MSIAFEKPIGAVADVKELEYVSALHQTDKDGVRVDGSIKGKIEMLKYQIDVRNLNCKLL